ncbi:MAG: DUF3347 domain-containing protein, partial [Planctomycetota bacterium]
VNGNFKIDSAIQIMAKPSMMDPEGGGPAPMHDHGGEKHSPTQARHKTDAAQRHDTEKHEIKSLDVPDSFLTQLRSIFSAYFRLQTALSLDKLKDAQKSSKDVVKVLEGIDMTMLKGQARRLWIKETGSIRKSATDITTVNDIKKARSSFALLSESMIAVARQFGVGKQPVYRLHCPMAFNNRGADWLQDKKQTANPYFGSAMFRCGSIKETFGKTPAEKSKGGKGDQ